MNVLVADDDGVTRLLLNSVLSKLGHSVQEAQDGRDALALWEKEQQHLVISDWMMPDIDGLEFCREIRAKRGSELTYIILLTARAGKANFLQAMDAGADDFLTKPFEKDQLAARVRVAQRILRLHENLSRANSELERRVSERTAELENALAVKNEFLSRASHELRTPMNHVLGFAQLLKMDAITTRQRTGADQILASGGQLLQLIDRLLAVSKSATNSSSFLDMPALGSGRDEMRSPEPVPSLNRFSR